MNIEHYKQLREDLVKEGYGEELLWASGIQKCRDHRLFFQEYAWVVLNSGMKNQVAEKIWHRVQEALINDQPVSEVFGHEGKAEAIQQVSERSKELFDEYRTRTGDDRLDFLEELPWIGPVTKYHLAKNLGHDCVKPDRHLVRVANMYDTDPLGLCQRISEKTGDTLALVDTVIWRAANLGMI